MADELQRLRKPSPKKSRIQIISQAATAMLAQANQQPQSVLALLK